MSVGMSAGRDCGLIAASAPILWAIREDYHLAHIVS
jgi:hypothetical protein